MSIDGNAVSSAHDASDPSDGDATAKVSHKASDHQWVNRTPAGVQMPVKTRMATGGPLLWMYAVRQVNLRYRQSVLGLAWTIVQPVAILAIYGFIFIKILDVETLDQPYLLVAWSGLTVWMYVQASIQAGAVSLLNDAFMISRVWFPREVVPLAPVVGGFIDLGVCAAILVPVAILNDGRLTPALLAIPVLLVLLVVWVSAISILTSTITVFFRDMATIVALVIRLLFIGTPVMYPAGVVPPEYGWVTASNPFAVIVDNLRAIIIGGVWPNWELIAVHLVIGSALLWVGLRYLRRVELRIVDII
jgi:lipopolysaccharide transport system permease protein